MKKFVTEMFKIYASLWQIFSCDKLGCFNLSPHFLIYAVADPGFPGGKLSAENCIKMKEFGPRLGGGEACVPSVP